VKARGLGRLLLGPWLAWPALAQAACGVVAEPVAFGAYDFRSDTALAGVGHIVIHCDTAADYQIALAPGAGSFTQRTLVHDSDRLAYNLYLDMNHGLVWGDGSAGTAEATGHADGTGTDDDTVIYGLVPARQNPPVGTYSDAIVVTLTF
jgi:spore coat protein U-like protein